MILRVSKFPSAVTVDDVSTWPQAAFFLVLTALTEGKGSAKFSYIDSTCVAGGALFVSCKSLTLSSV